MPAHLEHQSCRLLLSYLSKDPALRGYSQKLVVRAQRGQVRMQSVHDVATRSLKVGVIGAGAAGLVAARELAREGHQPTVWEQGRRPGGVWVYSNAVEEAAMPGAREVREQVHSSMYRNLRTNLPREVMSYTDFPFTRTWLDSRRFCSHQEVEAYLEAFADAFHLHEYIRYETRVVSLKLLGLPSTNGHASSDGAQISSGVDNGVQHSPTNGSGLAHSDVVAAPPRWCISTEPAEKSGGGFPVSEEDFDAIVVCNGHYSNVRRAELPGAESFPGTIVHSHSYRDNQAFEGLTVIVIGASASGEDICREISLTANKVYLSARSWQNPEWAHDSTPFGPRRNIWRRGIPIQLCADGSVEFEGAERAEKVDVVMHATGYNYTFPFLGEDVVTVHDNRIEHLYQHIFPPDLAPSISFVGLPWKVVPFAQYELQAKWIARVLSGRASLPSRQKMHAHIQALYKELELNNVPKRYTHMLGDKQWAYNDWLADACGDVDRLPEWRPLMYKVAGDTKRAFPERYRDEWPEAKLINLAAQEAQSLGAPVEVAA